MNRKKIIAAVGALTGAAMLIGSAAIGCDAGMMSGDGVAGGNWQGGQFAGVEGNYAYESVTEQGFFDASEAPNSYFSLDRNTANYAQIRAQINAGMTIAYDSVRTEELVNYFSYDYPAPEAGEEIAISSYLSDCPWNGEHKLATIGIRTEEKVLTGVTNNYVLLVDVSGSMGARVNGLEAMTRIDLVKYGAEKLVDGLGENDRVSIVTYASGVKEVLEPTLATEAGKAEIKRAVNSLDAYGSTNGAGGLELAYDAAGRYFAEGGNNRVVLLTDGDFNVGFSDPEILKEFVQEKAASGVYLSVLGVGLGNMRDDIMQTLAMSGNGNYGYIDTPAEAEKLFGQELGGMLYVVAKDAKAGVSFDAEKVSRYRLLGYDMKTMSQSEYENSATDAGEIGSNLCVTVMYELELKEGAEAGAALAGVEVKYKSPSAEEEERAVEAQIVNTPSGGNDQIFAACVMEFGLVLRQSKYKAEASLASVLGRLGGISDYLKDDPFKAEFETLVKKLCEAE